MPEELDNEEEKVSNPREDMVNLINNRREEQINSEILESGGTVEPMHPEVEELDDKEPVEIDNPLAGFIEEDENGKPMFKMIVDGEEVLMPLEQVQKERQLEAASRKRLEDAANWDKDLTKREEQVRKNTEALEARVVAKEPPPDLDADDQDFKEEAREIFNTLIEEDVEVASEKLAETLSGISQRASRQTPVDSAVLVERTTEAVTKQLTEKEAAVQLADREKDFADGLASFEEQYPDVFNDPKLYGAANNETILVAEEHPDWSPSQVIMEAGARTEKWYQSMTTPTLEEDHNDRQLQKDKLVAMPASRTGTVPKQEEDRPETPAEILAAERAARGQPS